MPQASGTLLQASGATRRIASLAFRLAAASTVPLVAVAAAGCSTPGTQVEDQPGLAGTYAVNGTDPVGIEYSGTVVIEEADDPDTFVVRWIVTGAIQEGIGTLDGDRLDVVWQSTTSPRGDSRGTATYTVDDDGNLTGSRTIEGVDGVGTEEIFQDA